jgi:hypothetical protein
MTDMGISLYLSKIGRAGGRASSAAKTPEQRSESARKASLARWAKHRKTKSKTQQAGGRA